MLLDRKITPLTSSFIVSDLLLLPSFLPSLSLCCFHHLLILSISILVAIIDLILLTGNALLTTLLIVSRSKSGGLLDHKF
ncbi:hypothetical protein L6452_05787 [Arctium lappa]|uniref:Uncharacterized protein n=1 Tax=Arctium lappa TaxID=4217 RepID=A0ACB9EH35_ARCLA|nr:hypothetical protein L6452_05787 [Arctium lappa]